MRFTKSDTGKKIQDKLRGMYADQSGKDTADSQDYDENESMVRLKK